MPKLRFKWIFLIIYVLISLGLFEKVYQTSKSVIDELFHIDQGLTYCYGFYRKWNPKITTLPGLYLLTIFLPRCSVYTLRLIPLVCSVINFWLIMNIREMIASKTRDKDSRKMNLLLDSLSIAILPPMYFFSFIYYSDIPSITTILLTILCSMKERHTIGAVFGLFSVLMRQTNIVWVAAVLGAAAVDCAIKKTFPRLNSRESSVEHLIAAIKQHLLRPKMIFELILEVFRKFFGYIAVIVAFMIFLYVNGSIVVGDKHAHEATIHLPQMLYFSLFTLIFGSSMWIPNLKRFISHLFCIRNLLIALVVLIILAAIIRYNTIVHPYLLADNRHFTFYVWNRFYARNQFFRYLVIPAYIFGLYIVQKALNGSIGFKIFFVISSFLTLCLQSLIEVRYFLIPFLILRLHVQDIKTRWTLVELFLNILLNILAFKVFFSIETKWSDYEEPQRIMW